MPRSRHARRSETAVVLFTLEPEVEAQRKRLGLRHVGRAVEIFATLIEHIASICASIDAVDLLVAAPGARADLPQRGRDFGESLRFVFDDAFSLGYRRVVVIGNDVPEITADYLNDALTKLPYDADRAVLGPARDGGYNLLGLTSPCPEAFAAMPWGSSRVGELTETRLRTAGFDVALLRTLSDIDTASALDGFLLRVTASGRAAPVRLAELVHRLLRLSGRPRPVVPAGGPILAFTPERFHLLRGPPALA